MPVAPKLGKMLELTRPNRTVRPGCFETVAVRRVRGYAGLAVTIIEPPYAVSLPIPARIVICPAGVGIVDQIAIRIVGEDVSGVVGDNIKNHVDLMLVGGLNKIAQILARPEVRVDIKKVLDAITVVARLKRNLAKNRTDPQRTDTQPLQVTQVAFSTP
jgi:hypothetical protein